MSYSPHEWEENELITKSKMNHIEQGIKEASESSGTPGQDGQDGQDGVDGKSAYELAVENGFEGTVTEWLASLHGKDGEDGVDGEGVPAGGSAGQVLVKKSSIDYDTEWQTLEPEGGGGDVVTGVTSFAGRTGYVVPSQGDYTAEMVGARPNDWFPSASDVGAVPTTRTVNGKPLSSNIELDAEDVGARSITWMPTADDIDAVPVDEFETYKSQVSSALQDKVSNNALQSSINSAKEEVMTACIQSTSISNAVSLTQTAYDALTTKDATTLYVILEEG